MRLLFITKIFLETTKITVGGEGAGRQLVFLLFKGSGKPLSKPLSIPPCPPLKGGLEREGFEFSPMEQKAKHPLASPFLRGTEGGSKGGREGTDLAEF